LGRKEDLMTTDVSKNLVEETIGVTGEPDLRMIVEGLRPLAVPISTLTLDPRNARKHGKANLAAIEDSLRKFGQQKPIVVDATGTIIAGNGTVEAAKAIGWTHVAAVRSNLSGPEAVGFAITDNRTAELAEWDKVELASLMHEIPENLVVGFDENERNRVLAALETPTVPVSFGARTEPKLKSEVYVEIYCSKEDYSFVRDAIENLQKRAGVIVNVTI
jgi:hypothetical protein